MHQGLWEYRLIIVPVKAGCELSNETWLHQSRFIGIFDESWGGIPGDHQASSPCKQGSQLAQRPRNSETTGQPRGQTHPGDPDLGREQTPSKINAMVKVTAAVQEVGSTEPDEHHANFSQQLPGIILHFRNPTCWYLQTIFSTEIPAYSKRQKMVSFPV